MTDFDGTVRWLLDTTDGLIAVLDHAGDDASRSVGARLRASVVGPLRQATGSARATDDLGRDAEAAVPPGSVPVGPTDPNPAGQLDGRLWELARVATELRASASTFLASARRPRPCKTLPSGWSRGR